MTLNLTVPQQSHTDFSPRIAVIGVGGGGTNAVDNMISLNLQGVEFIVANTDAQQLVHSHAERRIQLGPNITQGLGAGAKPEVGRAAAEEAADELVRHLDGLHMVFITAGMGGGTGTGAAPVIARMARERNILTVGVVTKPFSFEGSRRSRAADLGIDELQQYVDTLIVIPNQNLFRMANERTTWKDAFKMADQVLYMGVRGVTDLMMAPGLVNLDFADIRTVMAEMGKAMMGTGEAEGDNRAIRSAEAAISNPLLEDTSMAGARGLLINITGGDDLTLFEVDQAANRIREEVDENANIIFGSAIDETLTGRIRVSVVATGIDTPLAREAQPPRLTVVAGGGTVGATALAMPPLREHAPMAMPMTMAPPMTAPMSTPGPQVHAAPLRQMAPQMMPQQMAPQPAMMASAEPQPHPIAQEAPQPALYPAQTMEAAVHAAPTAGQPHYAAPPRQAAHQPQQPQQQPLPQYASAPSGGLFASPPATTIATPAPAGADTHASLFSRATGVFRRRPTAAAASVATDTAPRMEPTVAQQRAEPAATASVRQASSEEIGLEIPTFLRRQTSSGSQRH
jgi:cell division protein FtsZ